MRLLLFLFNTFFGPLIRIEAKLDGILGPERSREIEDDLPQKYQR